jgi:hypothetical protein
LDLNRARKLHLLSLLRFVRGHFDISHSSAAHPFGKPFA